MADEILYRESYMESNISLASVAVMVKTNPAKVQSVMKFYRESNGDHSV